LRSVGACSRPCATTSRASARRSIFSISVDISTSTSGPIATELSSTTISVRRSRSASISSLRNTVVATFSIVISMRHPGCVRRH
jgi:hypothetical protein